MRGTLTARLLKPLYPTFCQHCFYLFYQDKLIKHYSPRNLFSKKDDLGKRVVLVDLFLGVFLL